MDILSTLIAIFTYVGVAYGLMCVGQACGLPNPWLSWIPYANVYQLGLVADHYMARNENRQTKYRIKLLVTNIIVSAVSFVAVIFMVIGIFGLFADLGVNFVDAIADPEAFMAQIEALENTSISDAEAFELLGKLLGSLVLPALLIGAAALVNAIFTWIAQYRIYKLMDPNNAMIYLVLTILFTNLATPIIFLIISKKQPVYPAEGPFFETGTDTFGGNTDSFGSGSDSGSGTYSI